MKNTIFLLTIFLITSLFVFAQQNKTAATAELRSLLTERKEKFDSYSESLDKRSGFFGGKSKADINRSNEVLIDIVKTDNRIIAALNRVVDFRTFEKVNMNYDIVKCNEQLSSLSHALDTLNKQLTVLTAVNASLRNKSGGYQWLSYGLLSAIAVLVVLLYRQRIDSGA
jgi:hypothetical protein